MAEKDPGAIAFSLDTADVNVKWRFRKRFKYPAGLVFHVRLPELHAPWVRLYARAT